MLPLVVIALPVLFGMLGLGIDVGRMFAAQTRLQAAVDAAALAGALSLVDDPDIANGKVDGAVREYLEMNYPGSRATDVAPGPEVRSDCVTAQADLPLIFAPVLRAATQSGGSSCPEGEEACGDGGGSEPGGSGGSSGGGAGTGWLVTVSASACAGFNDLEVALVIDNSGSMNGAPMTSTINAANSLVDLLMPQSQAISLKVGLVPFRGKVNVDGEDGLTRGCRNANGTRNTAGPVANCWDYTQKKGAIPPSLALSGDKAAIKAAIGKMTAPSTTDASSGTIIGEGIKWGREVLTSSAPYTQGGDPTVMRKVMILLTDGDNEDGTCGGSYGNDDPRYNSDSTYRRNAYWGQTPPVKTCTCVDYGCLDQAMLSQASQAKVNNSIEIFVIRYGTSDATDKALLKQIASSKAGTDDHYFDAPKTSDIGKVFNKIGRQLGFRLL